MGWILIWNLILFLFNLIFTSCELVSKKNLIVIIYNYLQFWELQCQFVFFNLLYLWLLSQDFSHFCIFINQRVLFVSRSTLWLYTLHTSHAHARHCFIRKLIYLSGYFWKWRIILLFIYKYKLYLYNIYIGVDLFHWVLCSIVWNSNIV